MRETNIYHAIHTGVMDLKFCGADFNPDVGSLAWELLISRHHGGTIILPSSNEKGFEIAKYTSSVADIKDDGVTAAPPAETPTTRSPGNFPLKTQVQIIQGAV